MKSARIFFFSLLTLMVYGAHAQSVPAPDMPTVSGNTCGPRVLTRGEPPLNVTWYWVGTDPNSTSSNSDQTYTVTSANGETYYLRARSGSDWSAAVGVKVYTDPVDITLSSYDVAEVQATHSITLTTGFAVPPGKSFTARIGITSECNDIYNWSEEITYNNEGVPNSRARVFTNGTGEPIQNQSFDYLADKVWVSQPVRDNSNQPSLSTLPAPILENDFIYKKSFVTSLSTGQAYGPNDFDKAVGTNSGDVYNPVPVGSAPGTLGWYYSNSNTLEIATPTTAYPYARSYTEPGPDPRKGQSASPGDAYKMGSGHEITSEREIFVKSELSHYYELRSHFVSSPIPSNTPGTNLISNASGESLTGVEAIGTTISLESRSGSTYIKVVNPYGAAVTGISPTSSSISVTSGQLWTFSVQGYRTSSIPVNILVKNLNTNSYVPTPPVTLPAGELNKAWMENTFTIPPGCDAIGLEIMWLQGPDYGDAFYVDALSFHQSTFSEGSNYGYKTISTDPDGKKIATFIDADGHALASALITSTNPLAYDRWSYTYYNDLGQVVASVTPNGVTTSTSLPGFTNYVKYDHLGRTIEASSPDEGVSQFVYNLDGQIRFSQNQVQRDASPKRFSYTNYDYLGRLIESGEYTSNDAAAFIFESHTTTSPATNSILNIVENIGFTGISRKIAGEQNRCSDYSFIEYDRQAGDFTAGPSASQSNLVGQISKTENAISKTWYSYDEFGQLLWTKQNITGLGDKTIEYSYDYYGNVTEVAYQKASTTDRFYHHYTYDLNQRLSEVHTSKDGVTKTLQARYYYYMHGPLKRVELATNVQGIDYVYNIDGSLKMINHSDPALDPGLDGFSGSHAGFMKDLFGEVLDYNANDYSSPGVTDGTVALSGYSDQFGGNVKDIRWHSPTDNHIQRAYAYSYDNVNQLDNSKFGNVTGSNGNYSVAFPDLAYNEDIDSYDKNGNIKGLVRKDKNSANIGNYIYTYEPNTNKLNSVTDNAAPFLDYTYNSIGQMVQQVEGDKTMKIAYNPYGLVKEIRDGSDDLVETFGYDDRGNRITRTVYKEGEPSNTTYYVYDASGNVLAIYRQPLPGTIITLAEVPIYGGGRVAVYMPAVNTYFYEISDHLGNVRGVIGNPETLVYTATIEDNGLAQITNPRVQEMASFKNLAATAKDDPDMNHTAASQYMATPVYSSYTFWNDVVGSEAKDKSVGPAIGLKVEPGDKLDFEAWVKYEKKESYSRPGIADAMVSILAGSFVGTAPGLDVLAKATEVFQHGVAGALAGSSNEPAGPPHAYMYYLLYDNNFNPITAGWSRVGSAGGFEPTQGMFTPHGMLTIPTITINQPGYLYAFVVNESPQTQVWFDDFKVTHQRSTIVAGADYYPFGLPIAERVISREDYRYGYQGQFSEKDLTTGMQEFELRNYDARIGRWTTPDPYGQFASPYLAMANQPNLMIDPDGGCVAPCIVYLAEFVVEASAIVSTRVLPALSSFTASAVGLSQYVGNRLANGAMKTGNDVKNAYLNSEYFANSALHTILLGTWPKSEAGSQQQEYLQSAGQGFGEGLQLVNATPGSSPSPRSVLMTTNGVTVTITPGPVVPSVNMQDINANRNGHLSGGNHPNTDVPFDADGFPDFSDHLYPNGPNDIMIKPTGNRAKDFAAANRAAGYLSTPRNYTWHHHQTPGRMQLVSSKVHASTGHTGGFSLWGN